MKNNESRKDDEKLGAILKEWRADAVLPARFQEAVWRRIERAEQGSSPAGPSVLAMIAHWIEKALPRSAFAIPCLAVLLAIGVTAGWARASYETARVSGELSARYVQLVDPYQPSR
jgi:hypothetical protein